MIRISISRSSGLTDAANPLVFQGAKQFGLGLERHIPDFIQEQGAL